MNNNIIINMVLYIICLHNHLECSIIIRVLGKGSTEKKCFLSGIARMMGGGGLPMPEFFGPVSIMHFWSKNIARIANAVQVTI